MRHQVQKLTRYTPVWHKSPMGAQIDDFDLEDWALEDGWRSSRAKTQPRGWLYHPAIRFGLAMLGAVAITAFAVGLVAALYVLKSTLGVNLFADHSLLHDWLYRPN